MRWTRSRPRRRVLLWGVILLLLAYSGVSIAASVIPVALGDEGSIDLRISWYYGHYVRMGQDPYQAFREGRQLSAPVTYLDHPEPMAPLVIPDNWIGKPNVTAPGMLLLSLLSWFSWPTAKAIWLVVNLLLAGAIPWLMLRLLPGARQLTLTFRLLLFALFFALQGTRLAISVGQNTLFVLASMLGALVLRRKSGLLAGLLLGLALSKYSLTLPALLFLAFDRRYRAVLVGLAVQVLGATVVALLGHEPLSAVFGAYAAVLKVLAGEPGVHLALLFPVLSPAVAGAAVTVLTAGLLVWAGRGRLRQADARTGEIEPARLHVLAILMLWTLLVGYHRLYDTAALVIVSALVARGLMEPTWWDLSRRQRGIVTSLLCVFCAILCVPSATIAGLLPADAARHWPTAFNTAVSSGMLAAMAGCAWLLRRVRMSTGETAPDRDSAA